MSDKIIDARIAITKPPKCLFRKQGQEYACPHMKSEYSDWDMEKFKCSKCGYSFKIYEDEMK